MAHPVSQSMEVTPPPPKMNEALTKRAKHHKNLLHGFTNRWHIEYFQGIQEVSCNIRRKESKPDIEISEVVVVKNSNIARQMWKLAIVQEYIEKADGQIRAAVIRTIGKDGKPKIFRRSLRHLVPLEIKSTNIEH